jgi:hypothetical protein
MYIGISTLLDVKTEVSAEILVSKEHARLSVEIGGWRPLFDSFKIILQIGINKFDLWNDKSSI